MVCPGPFWSASAIMRVYGAFLDHAERPTFLFVKMATDMNLLDVIAVRNCCHDCKTDFSMCACMACRVWT